MQHRNKVAYNQAVQQHNLLYNKYHEWFHISNNKATPKNKRYTNLFSKFPTLKKIARNGKYLKPHIYKALHKTTQLKRQTWLKYQNEKRFNQFSAFFYERMHVDFEFARVDMHQYLDQERTLFTRTFS